MELLLKNGDYVPDGTGQFRRVTGAKELLARVLFKLCARRGSFPFLPELGSRLYLLGREKPAQRQKKCEEYVTEALSGEPDMKVTGVTLTDSGERGTVTVDLLWQGTDLSVSVEV